MPPKSQGILHVT